MAHLLAQTAVDALCLIDYGIEESLAVGLHGDAVLGALHCTCRTAAAKSLVFNTYHCFLNIFAVIFLKTFFDFIRMVSLSCFSHPIYNIDNDVHITHNNDVTMKLIHSDSI